MTSYKYKIEGTAKGGQTWTSLGTVQSDKSGEFMEMIGQAMRNCFLDLTEGKAIYGQPGVGCVGPYRLVRFMLEEVKE